MKTFTHNFTKPLINKALYVERFFHNNIIYLTEIHEACLKLMHTMQKKSEMEQKYLTMAL